MMWLSDSLTIALAVPAAAMVLWVVRELWRRRSPQAELDHAYGQFWEQRRGVPFEAQQTELTLRYYAARLRRTASEAAIRSPARYADEMDRLIQQEVAMISSRDRQTGQAFAAWAKSAPLEDILYPVAMKAVHRHAVQQPKRFKVAIPAQMRDDIAASLRVR